MAKPGIERVIRDAIEVLQANDRGRFTVPAEGLYPHQWLWDSAWIALGWRHLDEARAWAELESLFDAQWPDGMVPHITFREDSTDYFPGPGVWSTPLRPGQPASSGITQPPVPAIVLRRLYEDSRDRPLARRMSRRLLPRVLAFHRWLYRTRDPDGTGLVSIVHPWESGLDNSPAWDAALARVPAPEDPAARSLLAALEETRRDLQHVGIQQRPTHEDYQRYISLVLHFRALAYDGARIGREAPFRVVDAGFNALLYRANRDLLALLRALDPDAPAPDGAAGGAVREVETWLSRARAAFEALWSEQLGLYLSLDRVTGRLIPVPTVGGLLPLMAGIPGAERAGRMLATVEAWGRQCKYLVPSTSPAHPAFDPVRYWRGPVWVVTNWLLWQAARELGHPVLADRIQADTFALVQAAGFREYYHPETGAGLGGRRFSWSAALILDWAAATAQWLPAA